MTYLTTADAVGAKQSDRYYVELASEQHDFEGVAKFTRTIDLVVIMPTTEAIASCVAACGWLKGYKSSPTTNRALTKRSSNQLLGKRFCISSLYL